MSKRRKFSAEFKRGAVEQRRRAIGSARIHQVERECPVERQELDHGRLIEQAVAIAVIPDAVLDLAVDRRQTEQGRTGHVQTGSERTDEDMRIAQVEVFETEERGLHQRDGAGGDGRTHQRAGSDTTRQDTHPSTPGNGGRSHPDLHRFGTQGPAAPASIAVHTRNRFPPRILRMSASL